MKKVIFVKKIMLIGLFFLSLTTSTAQNVDVYVVGKDGDKCKLWKNGEETVISTYGTIRSVFVSNNDVYMAGNGATTTSYGLRNIAKIWKNGTATNLTDGTKNAFAEYVFVAGNDVYVAGTETFGPTNSLVDQVIIAKIWKNGVETALSTSANALSVFVAGNDVYVAGYVENNEKITIATLWKNGIPTHLSDGSSSVFARSVYVVDNNVYVAGTEIAGDKVIAKFWKNGVATNLNDSTTKSYAQNIIVSANNDVYISGYEIPNDGRKSIAKYWKNGVSTELTNGTIASFARSMFVFGNDIYVVGKDNNAKGTARLWKNGEITSLTDGTNSAEAYCVFVTKRNNTSVNSIQDHKLSLYPNPANDFIYAHNLPKNEMLAIYSFSGVLMLTHKIITETEKIKISHLPAGLYMIKSKNGQTLKLIKQ